MSSTATPSATPPTGTATVALVQVASPDDETPTDRIARVEALLRTMPDVDLFALPELWSPGYFAFERYSERAETLDGPTVQMAKRVARDLGAAVHLGSIVERDPSTADADQLHNTAVLIDANGEIAQVYRKIHVFGYQSLESELLTPGTVLSVVDSPVGSTASITCYDLRFPGLWQEISERGAEAVIIPAAWPAARREHWRTLTEARAIEHQVWVIACNAPGTQSGVVLGGSSRIVDPSGRVVAECGPGEETVIAELPLEAVDAIREEFPVLHDRLTRSEYASLSNDPGVR